jgi:hypothetical protein
MELQIKCDLLRGALDQLISASKICIENGFNNSSILKRYCYQAEEILKKVESDAKPERGVMAPYSGIRGVSMDGFIKDEI